MSDSQRVSEEEGRTVVASTSPSKSWTSLVTAACQSRRLRCENLDVAGAERLIEALGPSPCCGGGGGGDDEDRLADMEERLFESFVEDDYDGRLHLMALSDDGPVSGDGDSLVGLAFWREVPEEEMRDWIDLEALTRMIRTRSGRALLGGDEENYDDVGATGQDGRGPGGLAGARSESLLWLSRAASSLKSVEEDAAVTSDLLSPSERSLLDDATHSWVKIELLAVRPARRLRRLGSLLLACVLREARASADARRAVLHVAGGEGNIPATRLYGNFGFVPVERGNVFRRPDRDLYVLGNVERALGELRWRETLELHNGSGKGGE